MPKERWYPTGETMVLGNKVVPIERRFTSGGNETDEVRPVSSIRQPLKGPKAHGGHCSQCGVALEPMTEESLRGVCDACAKDDKRWAE